MAFAILVMHSVIAHCVTPEHAGAPQHSTSVPMLTSSAASIEQAHLSPAPDCDEHQHACVFIRDGEPVIPLILLVLLSWGFPEVRALRGRFLGWVRVLGRPPPWAIPNHLQLQVIRC
ncbi:hypothetical protein [Gordonia sp. CPCC 205515]|uniref:hypothetical protein n=1 Tax=Gordonia sp. CPCC 205515 TaxID=3140791 RepID=UPI003AF3C665